MDEGSEIEMGPSPFLPGKNGFFLFLLEKDAVSLEARVKEEYDGDDDDDDRNDGCGAVLPIQIGRAHV